MIPSTYGVRDNPLEPARAPHTAAGVGQKTIVGSLAGQDFGLFMKGLQGERSKAFRCIIFKSFTVAVEEYSRPNVARNRRVRIWLDPLIVSQLGVLPLGNA